MKQILTFSLIFMINCSFGQNCFNVVANLSGIEIDNFSEIESAACNVAESLPKKYESDFKVYSFDFYSISNYFQGSYPRQFDSVIEDLSNSSDYYLAFGNASGADGLYSQTFVKIVLPTDDSLHCLTSSEFGLIEYEIKNAIRNEYSSTGNYFHAITSGLNLLEEYILGKIECCNTANRSLFSCSCIDEDQMLSYLGDKGYEICDGLQIKVNEKLNLNSKFKEYAEVTISSGKNTINVNNDVKQFIDELGDVFPNVEGEIRHYSSLEECKSILDLVDNDKFEGINQLYFYIRIISVESLLTGHNLAIKIETNMLSTGAASSGTLYFINLDDSYNTSEIINSSEYFFDKAGLNIKTKIVNGSSSLNIGDSDGVAIIGESKSKVVRHIFTRGEPGNNALCDMITNDSHDTMIDFMEVDDPMNPEVSPNPVILVSTSDLDPLYTNWENIEKTNNLENNPNRLIGFIVLHGTGHLAGFVHDASPNKSFWEGYGYMASGDEISEYIKDYDPKLNFESIIEWTKEDFSKIITATNERFK